MFELMGVLTLTLISLVIVRMAFGGATKYTPYEMDDETQQKIERYLRQLRVDG